MEQYLHHLDPEAFLIITRDRRPVHARPTRRSGRVRRLFARVRIPAWLPRWVQPTTPATTS